MASGSRPAKVSSSRSLGSFVEIGSATSSEFEEVGLEGGQTEEMSSSGEDSDIPLIPSSDPTAPVVGKNVAPPPASAPHLKTVPEQAEIKPDVDLGTDPLQEGLQNLETATHKAAEIASAAAKEFTSKLTGGAAEARSSVMKLAGDVSSWWAALDPVPKPAQDTSPQATSRSAQGSSEVQDLFKLAQTEELMEKFACTLVQTFECRHNAFSQPQQVRSPGRLYLTDKRACFAASSDTVSFTIPHSDMKAAAKLKGSVKGLQLDFGEGQYVIFDDFKASDLDSALGLIELGMESV